MNTGEDIQALRKAIDFARLISIFILSIHFYIVCYSAFFQYGWTAEITDRIILHIAKMDLFKGIIIPKVATLLLLSISLLGAKGKKDEKIRKDVISAYIFAGLFLFFISILSFYLNAGNNVIAISYIGLTSFGYLLILTGGVRLSRLIKSSIQSDVFNSTAETFPQEERLIENEFSINLPAEYRLKNKLRNSWINLPNPFRAILVQGSPGSKTQAKHILLSGILLISTLRKASQCSYMTSNGTICQNLLTINCFNIQKTIS